MTSTLISKRPDGSEDRTCGRCGKYYHLPKKYEECTAATRDLCTGCIAVMQREEFERREGQT